MTVDIRNNIIKTAEDLFLRYGFKRVTMDDIARELAISKKTIYQYFKDKNEIVCSATEQYLKREQCQINNVGEASVNGIEYLVNLSKELRRHVSSIHPGAVQDLKKYFPEAWEIFAHYKREVFIKSIIKILKDGIEEGYFRPDIDPEVLAIIRLEQVQMAFDESVFPRNNFDFAEVQVQLLRHFIAGILTDKGREFMKQYSNQTNTNDIIF